MAKEMKKDVFLTTQRYKIPSIWPGKRFFFILTVKLDGITGQKWNYEKRSFFRLLFWNAQLVTGAKKIRTQFNTWLDLWKNVALDKLVNDSYAAAKGYLGRSSETKNVEQRHHMFSNIDLRG